MAPASEERQRYICARPDPASLMDDTGVLISVNGAWAEGLEHGNGILALVPLHGNYPEFCLAVARQGFPAAASVAEGCRDLLAGHITSFEMIYRHSSVMSHSCFSLRISRDDLGQEPLFLIEHRRLSR